MATFWSSTWQAVILKISRVFGVEGETAEDSDRAGAAYLNGKNNYE